MDFFCNNCERFSLNWCAVKALQWDQCYPSTRVQVSDKMPQNACKSSSGRDLQDVNQKEFISNVQRLEAEAWRRPTWSLSPSVCLSVPVFRRSRVFKESAWSRFIYLLISQNNNCVKTKKRNGRSRWFVLFI